MYDYLETPEWRAQRNRVLTRDSHTCQICGKSDGEMNVHHICYIHPLSEMNDRDLITLCRDCHQKVHAVQERMNGYAEDEMKQLKKTWAQKMAEEVNKVFPSGIFGTRKSTAISVIRRTFYDQRNSLWAIMPDFSTLQKLITTRRK